MSKVFSHKDKLNRELEAGQIVVCSDSRTSLMVARVKKLNPKMLTLMPINGRWTINRYPHEVVVLDSGEALMYVLAKENGRG